MCAAPCRGRVRVRNVRTGPKRADRPGTTARGADVLSRVQRHDRSSTPAAASRIRAAGLLLLGAHLLFVAWLTLRPLAVPWVTPPNLQPLATIRSELATDAAAALAGFGWQLALLAPLGVLLPLATGQLHRSPAGSWLRTSLLGAVTSLAFALVQSGVPGRVANVDWVLLNSAGVSLSCLLIYPPLRRVLLRRAGGGADRAPHGRSGAPQEHGPTRRAEEPPAGSTRRAPRVGVAP